MPTSDDSTQGDSKKTDTKKKQEITSTADPEKSQSESTQYKEEKGYGKKSSIHPKQPTVKHKKQKKFSRQEGNHETIKASLVGSKDAKAEIKQFNNNSSDLVSHESDTHIQNKKTTSSPQDKNKGKSEHKLSVDSIVNSARPEPPKDISDKAYAKDSKTVPRIKKSNKPLNGPGSIMKALKQTKSGNLRKKLLLTALRQARKRSE